MCGVIVVDAGRNRSTNLGRDAYIMIIALDIVIIIRSSINCPTVIRLPTVCYFPREKPLVKPTAPGLFLILFAFAIYFPLLLYSDLLNQKFKKYLAVLYLFHDLFILSITTLSCLLANVWHR